MGNQQPYQKDVTKEKIVVDNREREYLKWDAWREQQDVQRGIIMALHGRLGSGEVSEEERREKRKKRERERREEKKSEKEKN